MTLDSETPFPRHISDRIVDSPPIGMAPRRAPLDGKFVRLEPVNPVAHLEDLYAASHADEDARKTWDFCPTGPGPRCPGSPPGCATRRVAFTIRDLESGRATGMAQYLDIGAGAGVIEIGYIWFGPTLKRTRGATESMFLMIAHAMDDLGYRRMQWRCNSRNERSRTAARRLGFRFEGIFYNHVIVKGRNRDTAWYSILDDEWPEARGLIATWLADKNFDDGGHAKTSLSAAMVARGAASSA
jgi:hypothetical protein